MKHTIPAHLAMTYPVLNNKQDCEAVRYEFGYMVTIIIYLGRQDGFWVTGYELTIRSRVERMLYRNVDASRKWGEYPTRERGLLDTLTSVKSLLYAFGTNPQKDSEAFAESLKKVNDTIRGLDGGVQLQMFK